MNMNDTSLHCWTVFSVRLSHLEQNLRVIHLGGDCSGLLYWKQRIENKWRVLIKELLIWLTGVLSVHEKELRKMIIWEEWVRAWRFERNWTGEMEVRKGKGLVGVVRWRAIAELQPFFSSDSKLGCGLQRMDAKGRWWERSLTQRISGTWVLVGLPTKLLNKHGALHSNHMDRSGSRWGWREGRGSFSKNEWRVLGRQNNRYPSQAMTEYVVTHSWNLFSVES